ncbi:acyl CoA binding protein-domain-containing protein [Mrakia frigida]|uniref:acyl CoA binding protein-domain-containing protein n=1 Tax=Mrakia frigida TaxID=29902 RepID=UPI003FCBFA38
MNTFASSAAAPSQALFLAASVHLTSTPSAASLSSSTKLQLYALYKLCTTHLTSPATSRPSFWDLEGRAKWDAWAALAKRFGEEGGEQAEAQGRREYVEIVRGLGFTTTEQGLKDEGNRDSVDLERLSDDDDEEEELRRRQNSEGKKRSELVGQSSSSGAGVGGGGGMGGAVSQMSREGEESTEDDEDKPPHSHIINPSLALLETFLASNPSSINSLDPYGYSPLHLASDRNHSELVRFLLSKGADRTLRDSDGTTALEMAQANGEGWEEVRRLLEG